MKTLPPAVAGFFRHGTIAVVGVSRSGRSPANAIVKKLRLAGHTVYPVNPNAEIVDGERCWPDMRSLPDRPGAAVIVTRPDVAAGVVGQCADAGVRDVWLHRSFGPGSVSAEAVREAERRGVHCLAGGCPMMYCGKVDVAHACMRWILGLQKRLPS
jgi:uncharacterized protein